jgi:hypothetical protein
LQAARDGLSARDNDASSLVMSCASEVLKRMGASEEETVTVAGLAGGMGLSGNACGALGAVIWKRMLDWCKEHPGKNPPYFGNRTAKKIMRAFMSLTNSELVCQNICGRKFATLEEHTGFLGNGGCEQLIDRLALLKDA